MREAKARFEYESRLAAAEAEAFDSYEAETYDQPDYDPPDYEG